MSSLATTLTQEIRRIARKEARAEVITLRRQSAQYRRDIAALKRAVDAQAKELAFLRKQEKKRLVEQPKPTKAQDARFSPRWLKAHRQRLGLSGASYAKLVGASELSIYNWENGKASPRAPQRAKLAAVRSLGKREARKRLDMLGG